MEGTCWAVSSPLLSQAIRPQNPQQRLNLGSVEIPRECFVNKSNIYVKHEPGSNLKYRFQL